MNSNVVFSAKKFKALFVLALAALLSLGVYNYQGTEVSLTIDGETSRLIAFGENVEELLEREGIILDEGSYISVPLDSEIENKLDIVIESPKRYFLQIRNEIREIYSPFTTVREILESKDIEVNERDFSFPDFDEEVKENTKIILYQIVEDISSEEIVVPFEEEIVMRNDLDAGITRVVQEGQDGLKKRTTKTSYLNGVLFSTELDSEEYIKEPVNKVIERGARTTISTSRGTTRFKKAMVMEATAYDLSFESTGKRPGDPYYGITASGMKAGPGVVAVDPRVIPLGTRLYIESMDSTPSYGFAIAGDTGGAIKGHKIDLFFHTRTEVRNFGRRNVKVYILE